MLAYVCYCYDKFTYPKLMNQNDRDFQKVLEALAEQDKKISEITEMITESTGITLKAFDSQQKLNQGQQEVNHALKDGIKDKLLSGHSFRVGAVLDLLEKAESLERIILRKS